MSQLITVQNFTPEQTRLITDTVAKGATPDELRLFLYRCQNMGLDPLKPNQIHFVKYGNGPGTIVVGIDGFRAKAARTGKMAGIKREVLRDESGRCVGARCTVFRTDWPHPAIEEVPLSEYNTGRGPWQKMPETMIKKVAEAAALRMAFPEDLGGVYTQEEMDQAEKERGGVHPEQPEEGDGVAGFDTKYLIPFGKFAKRTLEEVGVDALRSYVNYLENTAQKRGETIKGQVRDFIERAEAFIGAFENEVILEADEVLA